jgi:hypothetical protein
VNKLTQLTEPDHWTLCSGVAQKIDTERQPTQTQTYLSELTKFMAPNSLSDADLFAGAQCEQAPTPEVYF